MFVTFPTFTSNYSIPLLSRFVCSLKDQLSALDDVRFINSTFSCSTLAIDLSMCQDLRDSSSDIIRSSNPRQAAATAIIPEQHILALAMTSMILTPGRPLTQDQAAHDRCSLTWFPGCRIPRGSASSNNALICFRTQLF